MVDNSYNILDCHFEESKPVLDTCQKDKFKVFQQDYNADANTKKAHSCANGN